MTVTERDGRFVSGLPQEAFSVFEDGVKQDVIFFSGTQLPTALGLLVDTSASMNEKLPIAQQAAIGFIQRMRVDDLLTIVDFDSRAEILQGFTAIKHGSRCDPADDGWWLDVAVQRGLRRAERVQEDSRGQCAERGPSAGHRRVVGR